jgi:thioredoxin reductase (NADPH)
MVEHASMQTSVPGVFAIGDIASYPGKLKLILTGFAEAARAAHSVYELIFPGKKTDYLPHSTSNSKFKNEMGVI